MILPLKLEVTITLKLEAYELLEDEQCTSDCSVNYAHAEEISKHVKK